MAAAPAVPSLATAELLLNTRARACSERQPLNHLCSAATVQLGPRMALLQFLSIFVRIKPTILGAGKGALLAKSESYDVIKQ
jgi:hypothetical protein